MAPGRIHTITTLAAASSACSYMAGRGEYLFAGLALLAGLYAVVVQPDLDTLDGGYGYIGLEAIGKPVERFWRAIWYLYAKLPHRSPLSHFPVVGTIGRGLYLFWPFLFVDMDEFVKLQVVTFFFFVTIYDTLHWVLDARILAGLWR